MFGKSYAKLIKTKSDREVVFEELKKLGKERISAGIHKSEGAQVIGENGVKLIDIAVQNHYGNEWTMPRTVRFQRNGKWYSIKRDTTIRIPATRFVTRLLEHQGERNGVIADIETSVHGVVKGYWSASEAAAGTGKYMRDRIKGFIDEKVFESNAPMTIDAKGFDKRLYDKGRLYDAITYRTKKARKK